MRAIIDVKSFTLEARESEHFRRYVDLFRGTTWHAGRLLATIRCLGGAAAVEREAQVFRPSDS